jgi:hypothetical protein
MNRRLDSIILFWLTSGAFMNPLVLILVVPAAASAFLGQAVDAGIIGAIVLLSTAMDLSQTYRSQKAIEQLRQRVAPTATVLRNGEWKEILRREVVPGDLVRLLSRPGMSASLASYKPPPSFSRDKNLRMRSDVAVAGPSHRLRPVARWRRFRSVRSAYQTKSCSRAWEAPLFHRTRVCRL